MRSHLSGAVEPPISQQMKCSLPEPQLNRAWAVQDSIHLSNAAFLLTQAGLGQTKRQRDEPREQLQQCIEASEGDAHGDQPDSGDEDVAVSECVP